MMLPTRLTAISKLHLPHLRDRLLVSFIVLVMVGGTAMSNGIRFLQNEPIERQRTVTDATTGLVWQKIYVSKTWFHALTYCESLNYGGHSDWRLPNKNELISLVNYKRFSPASDFPDMPSSRFWSSTSYGYQPPYAWYVNFQDGAVEAGYLWSDKTSTNQTRCVRGQATK